MLSLYVQVSDGAAAVMLMRRSHAAALGLPVLATVRSYAVAGVEPDEMGACGGVWAVRPQCLSWS